jgi:hypothetical protein
MIHLIFILVILLIKSDKIADYGNFCGLGHTSLYGKKPIDLLDEMCQIHDICVTSQTILNCFCNEQLYYSVSNFYPTNEESNNEKNRILSLIYSSVAGCDNYNNLDKIRYIASNKEKGFNYLPIYGHSMVPVYYDLRKINLAIKVYKIPSLSVYMQFTRDVYDNWIYAETIYNNLLFDDVTNYIVMKNIDDIYVVYNPTGDVVSVTLYDMTTTVLNNKNIYLIDNYNKIYEKNVNITEKYNILQNITREIEQKYVDLKNYTNYLSNEKKYIEQKNVDLQNYANYLLDENANIARKYNTSQYKICEIEQKNIDLRNYANYLLDENTNIAQKYNKSENIICEIERKNIILENYVNYLLDENANITQKYNTSQYKIHEIVQKYISINSEYNKCTNDKNISVMVSVSFLIFFSVMLIVSVISNLIFILALIQNKFCKVNIKKNNIKKSKNKELENIENEELESIENKELESVKNKIDIK